MPLSLPDKERESAAECLAHLKRLIKEGCYNDFRCFYCDADLEDLEDTGSKEHRPNCPYVAAKAFVEGQQGAR